jgi:hypothetical protein
MKTKDIRYDIIIIEGDNDDVSFVEQIDGEFDTLEIAQQYLKAHALDMSRELKEYNIALVIRKITREII